MALYYKLGALIEKEEDLWTNSYWQERERINTYWCNRLMILAKYINKLRQEYRDKEEYDKADALRDLLNEAKIEVCDLPKGNTIPPFPKGTTIYIK